MRKSDIAAHVAGEASLSKAQAESAVNAVFEAIQEALGKGDTVTVTGFGRGRFLGGQDGRVCPCRTTCLVNPSDQVANE